MEEYRNSFVECSKKFMTEFRKDEKAMNKVISEIGYRGKYHSNVDHNENLLSAFEMESVDRINKVVKVISVTEISSNVGVITVADFGDKIIMIDDKMIDDNGKFLFGLMKDSLRLLDINQKLKK